MYQFQISEMLQLVHLLLNEKGYHDKCIPDYTFIFCLTKPVDKELKVILSVIQAHERCFVAFPSCELQLNLLYSC